jgi:hypothetical protein
LCLLVLLEEPQATPSPRRMEIAKRLLGTCRRCVERSCDRKQRSTPLATRRVERSFVCPMQAMPRAAGQRAQLVHGEAPRHAPRQLSAHGDGRGVRARVVHALARSAGALAG